MTLVILAAGLGSRYGGESKKQLDTIGKNGEIILDYSVYDAIRAGFDRVVLLIKEQHKELFVEKATKKFQNKIKVEFAFQTNDAFCGEHKMPEERKKPWGTGHALLCCRDVVGDDNFAVVNADDFYGKGSYELASAHLKEATGTDYAMIGYKVKNTVTEQGGVSRGVCVEKDGYLTKVTETHEITLGKDSIYYPTPNGNVTLDGETIVSMNFFCFTPKFFDELEAGFKNFLEENKADLKKCEYYIPLAAQNAIDRGCKLKVIPTQEKWYGVTYATDKPFVVEGIEGLTKQGLYPEKLWD